VTPDEVADWLGVSPLSPGVQVKEAILEGMAGVRVPVTDKDHVAAFSAFLSCARHPGEGVLERCPA
jgi:hypothetical protein